MKKTLLGAMLLMALSISAQDYQWQWAKTGGGMKKSPNESSEYDFDSEQILDIAVDGDNNYYYLAFLTEQETQYDGTPIVSYNSIPQISGGNDLLLISTDCSGNLRWTQTIGGGTTDYGYRIALDNNGGLYLGAIVYNLSNLGPEYLPPHFTPNDALPVLGNDDGTVNDGYKTIALLKYNTEDGSLNWRRMPQGDVNQSNRYGEVHQVQVDSNGNVHTLMGFGVGTHLNGTLEVAGVASNLLKYYIVKYDSNGNLLGYNATNITGYLLHNHTEFRYDENLQRYYIAGFRTNGSISELSPLELNNTSFTGQAFVVALSNTGSELWRREMTTTNEISDNRIYGFEIDDDSNIYIGGKYFKINGYPDILFGSYVMPAVVEGNIPYVLKMNTSGTIEWVTTPNAYTTNIFTGSDFFYELEINGDEIAVAGQISYQVWGDVSVNRPANHLSDPGLLRLNKNTGQAIALHDIMCIEGYKDGLTAVAVDNDGNYITGGYFYYNLFTAEDDNVATVTKAHSAYPPDFFIAKLAAGPCGIPAANENFKQIKVSIYPNPATSIINIENTGNGNYEIVSITGQVLLKGNLDTDSTISIEGLSSGVYLLNITTEDNKTVSRKIIKQ